MQMLLWGHQITVGIINSLVLCLQFTQNLASARFNNRSTVLIKVEVTTEKAIKRKSYCERII